jgi:hypothetical protein
MVRKILPNNNEKCYRNFSPKIFASKHALNHFVNQAVKVQRCSCPQWHHLSGRTVPNACVSQQQPRHGSAAREQVRTGPGIPVRC